MPKNPIPVRDRIIATASRLFYEQGYNRTGINQILEESGVAKASMYDHFKSKEDICVAYLKQMDEQFAYNLQEYLSRKRKGAGRVLGLFDFLQDFYNAENFRGCWCLNTMAEIPQDNHRVKEEIRMQKESLREIIKSLVEKNLSDETDSSLADQLYLLYEGALMESYLHASNWPITMVKSMAKRLIT